MSDKNITSKNNNEPKSENEYSKDSTENLNGQNSTEQKPSQSVVKKPAQKSGIIRWSAILPLTIVIALVFSYFHFFFDGHMKSLIEWGGFKALGSEINIGKFESSFTKGRVEVSKIELTNAEKPELNSLEISSLKFDVNWDALLRMKVVIEEMTTEGIQFSSRRARPGKVAPPPPPSTEPSFTDQLQGKAVDKLSKDYDQNVLGDVAGFLKSGDINAQLQNIEGTLASKKLAEDMKLKWTNKQTEWDQKIKTLPTEKDLAGFKTRFEAIKYKDFKTPQELEASVNQFNTLKADVDTKVKIVDSTKNALSEDLKAVQTDSQNLEKQIKTDIDQIKTRFKIPKLDAGQFAKSLFMQYLTPYTQKLDRYKAMAQKYLPPKYSQMLDGKKSKSDKNDDDTIQPHPREKGVTYEFPVVKGYPLFWIQTIKLSSKSNAQADYGDIQGSIKNITSNQRQIGKATTLNVSGDFKSQNISGLKANAIFNNMKEQPEISFDLGVSSYPLGQIELLNSADGTIQIPKATSSLNVEGKTIGFKTYDLSLLNTFKNVNFETSAKEKVVEDILKQTFSTINDFDLKAKASGQLTNLNMEISSSLGEKLQAAFSALLQKKIDEVNAEIKTKIDGEIGKIKKDIDDQVNGLKTKFNGEINKAQSQLDAQKKLADDRIAQAKKDLENQAKNKLQQEGQKAVDDLKKKLGF
jgi:uncharacterized protein (TIGR03545 family)